MARRNRSNESNTEAQEAPVSTNTEAVEASPEAVEAAAQAVADETKGEKAPAAEVDLTAFKSAVEEAVKNKDEATGELAVAFIEPVTKAYRELEGVKAKNKAKAELGELMKASMNAMDIQTARAYLMLSDNLTAGSTGGGSTKAPADPTEAFLQRVVGLRLALDLASGTVPEGVAEDWQDKAKASYDSNREAAQNYLAWVQSTDENKGDEPEVSAVVKAAVKLSQGKAAKVGKSGGGGGTFTGERRDIGKHIANAFEGKESGTFLSIAEIRNTRSDEYGDNPPSAGAISARLFPSSGKETTVEGIKAGTNDKGKKGATKL